MNRCGSFSLDYRDATSFVSGCDVEGKNLDALVSHTHFYFLNVCSFAIRTSGMALILLTADQHCMQFLQERLDQIAAVREQ